LASSRPNKENASAINVAKAEVKEADEITKKSLYVIFCAKVTDKNSRSIMPQSVVFDNSDQTFYAPGLSVIRFITVSDLKLAMEKMVGKRLPIPSSFKDSIIRLRQFDVEEQDSIINTVSLMSKYPKPVYEIASKQQKKDNITMLSIDFDADEYIHQNDISGHFLASSLLSVGTKSKVHISAGSRKGKEPSCDELLSRHPVHPKTFISIQSSSDDFNCVACSFYNLMKIFYTETCSDQKIMNELKTLCSMTFSTDIFGSCVNILAQSRDINIKKLKPPKNGLFRWIDELNRKKLGMILVMLGNDSASNHCVACFDGEILDSSFSRPLQLTENNLSFCLGDQQQLSIIEKCYVLLPNQKLVDNYLSRFNTDGSSYEEKYGEQLTVDSDYYWHPKALFRNNKHTPKKRKQRSQSFDY